MSLPITITSAGLAKLPSPDGTGTAAIEITAIGVSATAIVPAPGMTELPGELYRLTSLSGSTITPDTIHVVLQDSSANAYSMLSFALYLADGTLFALYGQADPILIKTAGSTAMLACDIVFEQAVAGAITFGATNFNNPPATTNTMGVVQLATLAEAAAGTDAIDVLTPATALGALPTWLAPLLAPYATLAALANYATTAAVNAALAGYATVASLANYVTTAAQTAALNALLQNYVPGYGQSWQNMTAERTNGQQYTNTETKMIKVMVVFPDTIGGAPTITVVVNGVTLINNLLYDTGTGTATVIPTFEVAPGQTYSVTWNPVESYTGAEPVQWNEFR